MSEEQERRRELLDQLRQVLPYSDAWERWLARSGELPPDFDALPSSNTLPDLLQTPAGRIQTPAEWHQHRQTLREQVQYWLFGHLPPPPEELNAQIFSDRREEGAWRREMQLEMEFGASFRLEVMAPAGPGPFPVLLTQHNHRGWAMTAVRRGYMACQYSASDSQDDTDSFGALFPDFEPSELGRRAWAGLRCVDFLHTLPETDTSRIVITGHSRNGKQSLFAAAMDDRIAAVISSSSGAGGSMPARIHGEPYYAEGIEQITRTFPDWFCPRWRFFSGREDRLPVDMDALLALLAPRPCLISTAFNDGVENAWAAEKVLLSVRQVYALLDAPGNIEILWRAGGHETSATDLDRYLDWCDRALNYAPDAIRSLPTTHRPETPSAPPPSSLAPPLSPSPLPPLSLTPTSTLPHLHTNPPPHLHTNPPPHLHTNPPPYNAARWIYPHLGAPSLPTAALAAPPPPPRVSLPIAAYDVLRWRQSLRQAVEWALGDPPPGLGSHAGDYGIDPGHVDVLLGRSHHPADVEQVRLELGEYISGRLWLPRAALETGRPLPVVVWLPPLNTATGFTAHYWGGGAGGRHGQVYQALADHGVGVFCFDPIGCGRRVEEIEGFHRRTPRWSVLGKMVRDARRALDALERYPVVDASRLWLVGFDLGALVALHLTAIDRRPAGLALVCPPALSTEPTALQAWATEYAFLPRLVHHPAPYAVSDLLAAAAPRPALVVTPTLDRLGPPAVVEPAVAVARSVYALEREEQHLHQLSPETFRHFNPGLQAPVVAWLAGRLAATDDAPEE